MSMCYRSRRVAMWLSLTLAAVCVLSWVGPSSAASTYGHSLSKRSFFDIKCKGLYDKSSFARLERICEDCYSLYRDPELHMLCRSECFTSPFFKACVKVLLLEDQASDLYNMVAQIGR